MRLEIGHEGDMLFTPASAILIPCAWWSPAGSAESCPALRAPELDVPPSGNPVVHIVEDVAP
jgi:hypothetical protein